jgi:hypothetical protein
MSRVSTFSRRLAAVADALFRLEQFRNIVFERPVAAGCYRKY